MKRYTMAYIGLLFACLSIFPVAKTTSFRTQLQKDGEEARAVVPQNLPLLTVSQDQAPNIWRHINEAHRAGYPTELTRMTDSNRIRSNRVKACGNWVGPTSCDQYPFASTYEGREVASVAGVFPPEQQVQEEVIAQFYQRNNIQDGDKFQVLLIRH